MYVFFTVFLIDRQPRLQLHLYRSLAIDMKGNEVRAFPVIGKAHATVAVVRKLRGDLRIVVVFLSSGVQIFT